MMDDGEQVDFSEVLIGDEAGWNDVLAEVEHQLGAHRRGGVRSRQAAFLAAYEATFNVTVSAKTAGVARVQFYRWQDDDPVFQAALRRMQERMKDRVEQEIFRRAVLGVQREVWHRGEVVGREVQYSDRLLLALARRVDPVAWGERPELVAPPGAKQTGAAVRHILANPEARVLAQQLAEVLEARGLPQEASAGS